MALKAGHVMMQGDTITNPESTHAHAQPNDGAGRLVAKDARRGNRAVVDLLDIRGAHAAHGHTDKQFVRTNARHRHSLDAQVVHAAINHSLHRLGNGRQHSGVVRGI
jgi:hypothetical protein